MAIHNALDIASYRRVSANLGIKVGALGYIAATPHVSRVAGVGPDAVIAFEDGMAAHDTCVLESECLMVLKIRIEKSCCL